MDSYNRQEQFGNSEDEDQNFVRYMNENGVIRLEEGDLEENNQGFMEGKEDTEQLGLEEGDMLAQDEEAILFPESQSEGDRSGGQSWNEQFSFSQMPEEEGDQDFVGIHDTDDLNFMDQPSRSITLPAAHRRRPPSRDQQLDMTEDEVDQGSSLGTLDGDEEETWDTQQMGFLHNGSEHRRLEDNEQYSAGEDQWDNLPGSPNEDFPRIPGNHGGQAIKGSISPSSPPSTWDTRLFNMLSLSPRIEDETLPEFSHTDSGDGSAAIPSAGHEKISKVFMVPHQTRALRTKATLSPSSSPKMQKMQRSNEKKSKIPNIAHYGRGQLNFPLPDFSKVGPRVRFPRDEESYRPPQPRRPENQNQDVIAFFKSPAEIVKEILQNSVEKPVQEPAITAPQEFKTLQQATEFVHQLQENYHNLLTKHAEAENTIDRLRLGAKVHLFSDSAKPSHSVQMGTVVQGSKVMEFTIPHAQMASFSSVTEDNVITKRDTGSSDPLNHSASNATLPDTSGSSSLQEPEDNASTLRSHLETLYREVDLFKGLLQEGNFTPEEQQQAVQELRGSLGMLERRYLQAQEQCRQEQQSTGRPSQELDPKRELEEAIFQLGVQLDELQERIDHSTPSNADLTSTTYHVDNAPVPLTVVPVPATQTPYPQVTSPGPPRLVGTDTATLDKEDPAECLPQPLRFKHMQVEKDYGTLLSTYSSFKSLPDALGIEQDEWPKQLPEIARLQDHQDSHSGNGQFQASRPQDHAQTTKPQGLKTCVTTHHEDAQYANSQDRQLQTKANRHSPRNGQQRHSPRNGQQRHSPRNMQQRHFPRNGQQRHSPRNEQQRHSKSITNPSARISTDDMHATSSGSGTIVPLMSSPKEQRCSSSVSSKHSFVPDEGKSSLTRMPHGSMTFPQRVSQSSSLPQLEEQSPQTPTAELSASEESFQGPPSHKSRSSMKNINLPGHRGSPMTRKGSIAQRRILSPETDSGFLGSESGRSFPLHKQRYQQNLNSREEPAEIQDSFNAAVKNKRRPSKNGNGIFSGTHKVLDDSRKPDNRWIGPSAASSPSMGPKSLTDESREQSPTDESDLEHERSNNVIDVSSGTSVLPSPIAEPSQPLRDIMESRDARDQAILNIQKEVTQLRHHLENSLNRSPARGKPRKAAVIQKQHDPDLDSDIYRQRTPVNYKAAERQWRNSVSHDHDPTHQAPQGGKKVQGPYTGTQYQFTDTIPIHPTEHVNVPHCQRCLESAGKKHVTMKTSKEDESFPPTNPACPLCKVKNGSDNAPRTEMTNSEHRRHRRHPHWQHWYMSHPPTVSYISSPLVPYSPPIIYSSPPGVYVPVGYSEVRSSFSEARSPNSDILDLDDLSYPLSRALEAADELKITSKRMYRSLTMDIDQQRSLRGSCLF